MEPSSESLPPAPFLSLLLLTGFASAFGFQDARISLVTMCALAGFVLLLWASRRYMISRPVGIVLLIAVAMTGLSFIVSKHWYYSTVSTLWLWIGIIVYLVGSSWLRDLNVWRRLSWWMVITGTALAGIGLWFVVQNKGERAGGILGNANGAGGVLLWGLFMSAACVIGNVRRRWTVPMMIIILAGWLSTISLTAFVASLVPLVLLLIWNTHRLPWRLVRGVAVLGVVAVASVWFIWHPEPLVKLMTGQHIRTSFDQRVEFNRVAWRMWLDKPLTGWGMGTYRQVFPRYTNQFLEQPLFTHNTVLQLLAENGIVVTLIVLGGAWWVVRRGWSIVRIAEDTTRPFLQGAYLGWVAFTIHALIDFSWFFIIGQLWWILVTALIAAQRQSPTPRPTPVWSRGLAILAALAFFAVAGLFLFAAQASTRGLSAAGNADETSAIAYLTTAVRYVGDPNDAANLAEGYHIRRQDGDLERGETVLRTSLYRNADEYSLHNALGVNLAAQKKTAEALLEFKKAYELDPWFHPVFTDNYIRALANNERLDEATSLLRQVIARYSAGPGANPVLVRQLPFIADLKAELLPNE